MVKYNQKQLRGLFKVLPEELKEAIFSEETAEKISTICEKYKIEGERKSEIAKLVGNSLMGLLSPDKLQNSLEQEINIESLIAEKISLEINRFILYPLKEVLGSLYETELAPSGKIIKSEIDKSKVVEEEPKNTSEKDTYRELIEE